MTDFFHIRSISEVNGLFGIKPVHPLITIIRQWPEGDFDIGSFKITNDLYLLSLKGKTKGTSFKYGKNSYDFEDGILVFLIPNQVISLAGSIDELDDSGWNILLHPDLIRKSSLSKTIKYFSFFNYKAKKSLLNSNVTIGEIAYSLGFEYSQYFSKLFKIRTSYSPSEYGSLN